MDSSDFDRAALMQELTRGLAATRVTCESLAEQLRESEAHAREADVRAAVQGTHIEELLNAVRAEGNGSSGLLRRTATLENAMTEIRGLIGEMKQNCKNHFQAVTHRMEAQDELVLERTKAQGAVAVERVRGQYLVMAAMCGGSGVIGGLVMAVASWWIGGAK